MANYVTSTSDKSKKTALLVWAIGGLGILGLENFYVLKIKNGLLHLSWGTLVFIMIVSANGDERQIPLAALLWAISGLPNLVKLLFGIFRDNIGQPLRK